MGAIAFKFWLVVIKRVRHTSGNVLTCLLIIAWGPNTIYHSINLRGLFMIILDTSKLNKFKSNIIIRKSRSWAHFDLTDIRMKSNLAPEIWAKKYGIHGRLSVWNQKRPNRNRPNNVKTKKKRKNKPFLTHWWIDERAKLRSILRVFLFGTHPKSLPHWQSIRGDFKWLP